MLSIYNVTLHNQSETISARQAVLIAELYIEKEGLSNNI